MSCPQSTIVAYAVAAATAIGSLSLPDWGVIVGIVASVGTFVVNLIVQRARLRRMCRTTCLGD